MSEEKRLLSALEHSTAVMQEVADILTGYSLFGTARRLRTRIKANRAIINRLRSKEAA